MYRTVTIMAEWYYIQLVFVAIMVMVVLCHVVTHLALKQCWWVHAGVTNSIINSIVGITLGTMFHATPKFGCTTLWTMLVASLGIPKVFWSFLAGNRCLCYNSGVHNQFLNNWLWLKPVAAHTAVGFSYCTIPLRLVNYFWRNV